LKSVALEKELSYRYWTDSDGDGLSDLQEVRTDRITHKSDGTVALPTYYEYIQKYNAPEAWLVDWAYRYNDVEDFNGRGIQELLEETYVLPVKSDPTLVDSDGDGISDYDECVWDGVDERYRDLGPLHKDTIETLFPEFAKTEHNEPKNISYITVKDNDVVVHTKVTFSEGANENALKYLKKDGLDLQYQQACDDIIARVGEDVTFKDLIKDALSSRWEGTYEGSAYDFYEGLKVNFAVVLEEYDTTDLNRAVRINVKYGSCGVSNVSSNGWYTNIKRVFTLYTGYCDDVTHKDKAGIACKRYMNSRKNIVNYSGTCAHEFGHVWGVADMYDDANNGYEPIANAEIIYDKGKHSMMEGYGIMLCNGSAVSNDIEMVLLAFSENRDQFFVPNGADKELSKAIKQDVEYRLKGKMRQIFIWNESKKNMELKQP